MTIAPEDSEMMRGIIDHFARDERAMISLMGVLAQVGLCAIAMDDCTPDAVEDGGK